MKRDKGVYYTVQILAFISFDQIIYFPLNDQTISFDQPYLEASVM